MILNNKIEKDNKFENVLYPSIIIMLCLSQFIFNILSKSNAILTFIEISFILFYAFTIITINIDGVNKSYSKWLNLSYIISPIFLTIVFSIIINSNYFLGDVGYTPGFHGVNDAPDNSIRNILLIATCLEMFLFSMYFFRKFFYIFVNLK